MSLDPKGATGVQLAETTKQEKKRNVGVVKDRRRQGRDSDDMTVMMLSKGRDGRFTFAEGRKDSHP